MASEGLWHCGKTQEWKDMLYRIIGDRWQWFCRCGDLLREDPYHPPLDVSFTSSQPNAQNAQDGIRGIGIPVRGVEGQGVVVLRTS